MKIATFNINNVNRRLPNLLDWLEGAKPDVVCLQELKAEDHAFPADALAKVGYTAVWKGQKSWNGVAILSRKQIPVLCAVAKEQAIMPRRGSGYRDVELLNTITITAVAALNEH